MTIKSGRRSELNKVFWVIFQKRVWGKLWGKGYGYGEKCMGKGYGYGEKGSNFLIRGTKSGPHWTLVCSGCHAEAKITKGINKLPIVHETECNTM